MRTGFIRRLAERVVGPLVVSRRLPADSGGGTLYASGRIGGLRYLFKESTEWDPDLLHAAHVLVRVGAVVWDIGANVGLFTKAAAFLAGPGGTVVAFEPDADAMDLLTRTQGVSPASDPPICLVHAAVSDATGYAQFAIPRRSRAANAIAGFGSTQTGGVAQIRTVPCATLDAFLGRFEPPWVLKIDVEGAEVKVLQGAERMLSEVRPWIDCEVAGENAQEVFRILTDHEYRLVDASNAEGAPLNLSDQEQIPCNTIAVPREQFGTFHTRATTMRVQRA